MILTGLMKEDISVTFNNKGSRCWEEFTPSIFTYWELLTRRGTAGRSPLSRKSHLSYPYRNSNYILLRPLWGASWNNPSLVNHSNISSSEGKNLSRGEDLMLWSRRPTWTAAGGGEVRSGASKAPGIAARVVWRASREWWWLWWWVGDGGMDGCRSGGGEGVGGGEVLFSDTDLQLAGINLGRKYTQWR